MSYPAGERGGQVCAVCLFARTGPAEDAVTTINGCAVCDDHLSIAAGGGSFNSMITAAGGLHSPPRRAEE